MSCNFREVTAQAPAKQGTGDTTVYWDEVGLSAREAVCELVGWCNSKGGITPTGKRIARTKWDMLSLAAIRVFKKHGVCKTRWEDVD